MSRILSIGDNCIDRYLTSVPKSYAGGNAVNTAVHMKLAGGEVSYIGAVGRDNEGSAILEKLASKGIDVSYCQTYDTNTAYTDVGVDEDGNRVFLREDPGATDCLTIDSESLSYIRSFDLVHNTWLGRTEKHLAAFRDGQKKIITMDYGERYSDQFLAQTLAKVDIAFFSTHLGEHEKAESVARYVIEQGPLLVVVTMGEKGSLAYDGAKLYYCEAEAIEAVDTLGAGDTYIANFLVSWLQTKDIALCMEAATQAAAKTCVLAGAWEDSEIFL